MTHRGDVGAAAQRSDLVVDQVMAEYRAYCAGELWALCMTTDAPDGCVEYCGVDEDPAHWAICYVRASNRAVVPLVVGQQRRVYAEFDVLDRRVAPVWDPLVVPTPVAVIGGREYPFQAARGRHLLGVVQLERQAVLLAAADDRLVAVLVADGATTVLPLGRPRRVREVDVDLLRAWARPHAATNSRAPDAPLRPSADTRAHHIRIVPGRRVVLDEGLTLSQLLAAMFADIEARAITPPKPPKPPRRKAASPAPKAASASPEAASAEGAAPKAASAGIAPKRPKLKGKTWVPHVLKYLRKMVLDGSLDLVGLSGTIIATIQARFPEFKITSEAFADAMKLIAATGTCLVAPHQKGERIWRINLEGLSDPTSAQHRRLCRETRGRVRVEEAAANQRSPPAAGEPSRTVDAEAAPGHATHTGNSSPGEHRDKPPGLDTAAPDGDRSAAQTVPAGSVSAGPMHETLELIRRLSMIPDAGHEFFLACRMGMAVAELLTAAAGNDVASARVDTGAALDATGPSAPVDAAPHADEAVVLDAAGEPPVEEVPPAGEAVAFDAAGPAPLEDVPPDDQAIALDATAAADVEDGRPADEAVVSNTAGVSAAGVEDPPDTDSAVVADGTADDASPADEALASAVSGDDAARDGTVGVDDAPPCTGVTADHAEIAAEVDRPIRDAVLPRHQALSPVQPEPRCRDLGTLGPRGPPASRSG